MEDFVQSLLKKDDDAEIIDQTEDSVTIETSIILDEIDEALEDKPTPFAKVPVRIMRTVAWVHTGYTFLMLLWCIIPYYFFRSDIGTKGLEWMLLVVSLLCVAFYVFLCFIQRQWAQITGLAIWMFLLFMVVNVLAALLKNLSPFQAVLIHFCQGVTMLVYCYRHHKQLDAVWCCGYMAAAGLVSWLIGFVVFLRFHDWITSFVLLLVFVIGSSVYSAWQITLIHRFDLSTGSQIDAVRHFYVDLILIPAQWMKMKWSSSSPPTQENEL